MLTYNLHIVDGIYFELTNTWEDKEYLVKILDKNFLDPKKRNVFESKIKKGEFIKYDKKYLSNYFIEIWDDNILKESISLLKHLEGTKVFITFESKSLGDTLAWMPYCLEFKNHYKCSEVVVSSFMNEMFESEYPELTFVPRGTVVHNIIGMFRLGWYFNYDFEPINPVTVPLQKAATNILNLPFTEIKPRMSFRPSDRPIEHKYIAISTNATSQCKHWYYWQDLVNILREKGYKLIEVSLEGPHNIANFEEVSSRTPENLMNIIHHAEFFIGLGSGSSWLSWALNKKVVMICNFSEKDHEFMTDCIRITDESVCHGCWNSPNYKFDRGDWYWCPRQRNSTKEFECQKAIGVDKVIDTLVRFNLI